MIITSKGLKRLEFLRQTGTISPEFLLLNAIDLEGHPFNVNTGSYQDYIDLHNKGYIIEEDEDAQIDYEISKNIHPNSSVNFPERPSFGDLE